MRAGSPRCITVLAVALAPFLARGAPPRSDQPLVVTVTTSAVEAFDEATEGILYNLGPGAKVAILDLASNAGDLANLAQKGGSETGIVVLE